MSTPSPKQIRQCLATLGLHYVEVPTARSMARRGWLDTPGRTPYYDRKREAPIV